MDSEQNTDKNASVMPISSSEARERQLAGLKPFQKGHSGNPGGRVINTQTKVKNLAKRNSNKALRTLIQLMEDPNENGMVRRGCANDVLCWAWGKPEVQTVIRGEINHTHEHEIVNILQLIEAGETFSPDGGASPLIDHDPEELRRMVAEQGEGD